MTRVLTLSLLLLSCVCSVQAVAFSSPFAEGDTLVKIHGVVTNKQTSEPIEANITYEKLPYGDDMGIAKSKRESGNYQMYMVKQGKYKVRIQASGYITLNEEMLIDRMNDNMALEVNFALQPTKENEVIRLENLLFARTKANITESSHDELDKLVDLLNERPKMIIQLEGHTDFQGNARANMELSQKRVEAVKKYLVNKGIKKKRILLKAFGGERPLTRERTPEGRRLNRRVEVRVMRE